MKYAALIQLGAADGPLEDLGDRSPLEAAEIPAIRSLAELGKIAAVSALSPEDDATDAASLARAVLSLLGYDPRPAEDIGAGLSAAAVRAGVLGLDQGEPAPWCIRASLIAAVDAEGRPSSSLDATFAPDPELTADEAGLLWDAVERAWAFDFPEIMADVRLIGEGVDRVLIDRSSAGLFGLEAQSADIGQRVATRMPGAGQPGAAARLHQLMQSACKAIAAKSEESGMQRTRESAGLGIPTMVWFDGPGRRPTLKPFRERFGIEARVLTDDPGSAAVAAWAGLPVLVLDTTELGSAAVDALASTDAVLVIDTSAARAALAGDAEARQRAIGAFDASCVDPVAKRLRDFGDPERDPSARGWRLMVTPGVRADAADRTLMPDVVPVLLVGAWIRTMVKRSFTEEAAEAADLRVDRAHELMEFFLLGGLAKARGVPKSDPAAGSLWETAG